jgi:hypothetical protein
MLTGRVAFPASINTSCEINELIVLECTKLCGRGGALTHTHTHTAEFGALFTAHKSLKLLLLWHFHARNSAVPHELIHHMARTFLCLFPALACLLLLPSA